MDIPSKIRLAIVSETTIGGTRKHIVDLLLGLNKNKYEIFFIFSTARADETFMNNLGRLKKAQINLIEIPMKRGINPAADFISLIKLYNQLKKINPAIIHLNAAKAGALGRIAAIMIGNKKVIYNPHGGSFHKFNEKLGFFYMVVEKFLARKYVHFIGVSKFSCDQFEKKINIKPANNHLIHNGISAKIDLSVYDDRSELKKNSGLNNEDFVVLFPATFYPEKGHLIFINSYQLLNEPLNPKIKLLFAGDGPLRNTIEKGVQKLKLNNQIVFTGFLKNIEEYYLLSDIVILPSQKEFLPYAILEAMVFSKPVFASNTGAISEMVIHKFNGELFSPDNLVELWKRLNYFSFHKKELEEMGSNGRRYVEENFSLSRMVSETEILYDKLNSNSN